MGSIKWPSSSTCGQKKVEAPFMVSYYKLHGVNYCIFRRHLLFAVPTCKKHLPIQLPCPLKWIFIGHRLLQLIIQMALAALLSIFLAHAPCILITRILCYTHRIGIANCSCAPHLCQICSNNVFIGIQSYWPWYLLVLCDIPQGFPEILSSVPSGDLSHYLIYFVYICFSLHSEWEFVLIWISN